MAAKTEAPARILTGLQAEREYGWSARTLYEWSRKGLLRNVVVNGRRYYDRVDLEAFIESRKTNTPMAAGGAA